MLKIALLNETNFKVKFKFKVENCVSQISLCTRFLGEIFDRIQLVSFFLIFCSEIEKKNQNMFISASTNLSGMFGCN